MMGIFSGIKDVLFGGPETAAKTVDFAIDTAKGIGGWIDEQQYTPEEQAKAHGENLNRLLKAIELTRDENSTRSVTRRYLAWGIMGAYIIAFFLTISVGYWVAEYGKFTLQAVQVYGIDKLAWAVGGFYFLTSIARSRVKK